MKNNLEHFESSRMAPKHAQLQIFIQANVTMGKNESPAKNDHIWLVVIL